jgi:hypothetical protein
MREKDPFKHTRPFNLTREKREGPLHWITERREKAPFEPPYPRGERRPPFAMLF